MTSREITRRALGGATLLGVAAPLLVGCTSDEPTTVTRDDSGQGAAAGEELAATSEVPVGGGVVVKDAKVVVTQPAEGTFKCFTAICTHQGCLVSSVSDGEIACACHGSVFSAEDGSVVNGPAQEPLEEFPVTVEGGQVTRA
jgi:nitrite reductase/ring-hydroxylating ferredoxin subunit